MTFMRKIITSAIVLIFCLPAFAQKGRERPRMLYEVVDGDTVYLDVISPTWVFPKGSKVNRADWRKHCRLVYNFNKVYPYALLGKEIVRQVDLDTEKLRRGQKERYINKVQKQLLDDFEGAIREMTISQGQLLVRLVDREVGMSSYKIIKYYKSGIAAGFWQGVGKLFGQNLKNRYDPDGEDKETEKLVQMWKDGEFEAYYFSIFFEMPKKTEIPSQSR